MQEPQESWNCVMKIEFRQYCGRWHENPFSILSGRCRCWFIAFVELWIREFLHFLTNKRQFHSKRAPANWRTKEMRWEEGETFAHIAISFRLIISVVIQQNEAKNVGINSLNQCHEHSTCYLFISCALCVHLGDCDCGCYTYIVLSFNCSVFDTRTLNG